ncbi:hypothetical protein Dda_5944 [Drechslerella dactyloides]|uniref:Uncharacterized protein n=1 Tax=Drechslerella dactyloides TaxID=74499 RepID=A0AAD6IUY5_DREDA|nr:hypothetical protein Dda_5944 [Drechslerella dactyloides]
MDPNAPAEHVKEEWKSKLVGKKIVDDHSNDEGVFCKRDLPQGTQAHRVIPPGAMVTKDYQASRLNVHVDDDARCTHITFG